MYLDKVFVHVLRFILYSVRTEYVPESWIVLADFSVSRIAGSTRLIYFSVIVILHNSSVSYQAGKTGNLVSQDKTQRYSLRYRLLQQQYPVPCQCHLIRLLIPVL